MFYKFQKQSLFAGLFAGFALTTLFAFFLKEESRDALISCDFISTMYCGVNNPITILTRDIPGDSLKITVDGCDAILKPTGGQRYIVQAEWPGALKITISDGLSWSKSFNYAVKRIPDPQPMLGARYNSRTIDAPLFKAQSGVAAIMLANDCDMKCNIDSYAVTRIGKKEEGTTVSNTGARFEPATQQLVDKAEKGNWYFFEDIKARCPGDKVARDLGVLSFRIK